MKFGLPLAALTCLAVACGGESRPPPAGPPPDGGPPPSAPDAGPATPDAGPGAPVDAQCAPKGGPAVPPGENCGFAKGSGAGLILRGTVAAPDGLLEDGEVLVLGDQIRCAACDCASDAEYASASVLNCPGVLIGPGLINAHEHLDYGEGAPIPHGEERYEHRHDWRTGTGGHRALDTPSRSTGDGSLYGELRHLFGGATSVNGSTGKAGLLRNLDGESGLAIPGVQYSTFPLGDASRQPSRPTEGCRYPRVDRASSFANKGAYTPHIAEGIGADARNEFACLSGQEPGGVDLITEKTAVMHGIALTSADYAGMVSEGASLIWSPRSNIDLYGHTAQVTLAHRLGLRVALGTDWPSSGSINLLRELVCAQELNKNNYGSYFSDRDLYAMVTSRAAEALGAASQIGSLRPGLVADLTLFSGAPGYRAVIEAEPKDVVLVLRGGEALYGNAALVDALRPAGCEVVDVCQVQQRVCVEAELGQDLAALSAAVKRETIGLFYCDQPGAEASCTPFRMGEFEGIPTAEDPDGDGLVGTADLCPTVFSAPRDVDAAGQADTDGDGLGDVCDVCPFDANTEACMGPDPDDQDQDGSPNATDNCPRIANPMQEDGDSDSVGDACDACPAAANPGGSACPATIAAIKRDGLRGPVVIDEAIVTAVSSEGYVVQTTGDFGGLYVYAPMGDRPARGDRVALEGIASIFREEQIQLTNARFTVLEAEAELPAPLVVRPDEVKTGGERAAALESVLVVVQDVTVTRENPDAPNDYGEFEVDGLRIDDFFFALPERPALGARFGSIVGILRRANGNSKLEPRDGQDLGQEQGLLGFEPANARIEVGSSTAGLTLRLTQSATAGLQIALESDTPEVQVPATIEVPAGADRIAIPLEATSEGAATIRATYRGATLEAQVQVVAAGTLRRIVSLTFEVEPIAPSSTTRARVTLNQPAGAPIRILLRASGLITVPSEIEIAAGADRAEFEVSAGETTGSGTLEAQLFEQTVAANFTVGSVSTSVPSAPDTLWVNEVMANPSAIADDRGEWVELYNPSQSVRYDLTGCVLGDDGGDRFTLPAIGLDPGAYLTLARSAEPGFEPDVVYSDFVLANGDDEVVLRCGDSEVARLAYGQTGGPSAPNGASLSRDPNRASYCPATTMSGGDRGTPGGANDLCSAP